MTSALCSHSGFGKDPRKSKFQIDAYVPIENMVGRYKLTGKMLVLPLNGHGAANITISEYNITCIEKSFSQAYNLFKLDFLSRT